ncbi:inosine/xanthosine triphosphatase [Pararhodonellum marinum]|uniref:inosine/xanthosine triphosphatase n=1 Tax=Pararhodonellum marinum TaxID=2755358 RepID=UPI00188DC967|nr:inosine/xanthosine triphosphatase [Pararhodonellum marinum]
MSFPKRKNIQESKREKLIIVGSKNPVKIFAVDQAFESTFEEGFIIQGLSVDSGIKDQPFGDQDTYQGAFNRAFNSKNAFPEADFWVGIEGGVEKRDEELMAFAWVVTMDQSGKIGKSKTATFFLPKVISDLILNNGMELGEADDAFFNKENSKQGSGAVGILTDGLVERKDYYKQAVILSLIPFKNPTIYS